MKRGHSNVKSEKTEPWNDKDTEPGIAKIPLGGGATIQTFRELPPLALRKEEWQEIGYRMGWLRKRKPRTSN
jgi:hypothetical protein